VEEVCPIDKNSPYILVVTADGGGKFVFARLKKRQEFHSTCFPFFEYSHRELGILHVFKSIYRF
jgi:hypothetical protein